MISQIALSKGAAGVIKAKDTEAINSLLMQYFDALYYCDSTRLREVLHSSALYATIIDNKLRQLTMEEYWPIVDTRVAPALKGEARHDRILSIDIFGAEVASAKVECALSPNFYTDCLSLLKLDNRWWIIAKVFQIEILQRREPM